MSGQSAGGYVKVRGPCGWDYTDEGQTSVTLAKSTCLYTPHSNYISHIARIKATYIDNYKKRGKGADATSTVMAIATR